MATITKNRTYGSDKFFAYVSSQLLGVAQPWHRVKVYGMMHDEIYQWLNLRVRVIGVFSLFLMLFLSLRKYLTEFYDNWFVCSWVWASRIFIQKKNYGHFYKNRMLLIEPGEHLCLFIWQQQKILSCNGITLPFVVDIIIGILMHSLSSVSTKI